MRQVLYAQGTICIKAASFACLHGLVSSRLVLSWCFLGYRKTVHRPTSISRSQDSISGDYSNWRIRIIFSQGCSMMDPAAWRLGHRYQEPIEAHTGIMEFLVLSRSWGREHQMRRRRRGADLPRWTHGPRDGRSSCLVPAASSPCRIWHNNWNGSYETQSGSPYK